MTTRTEALATARAAVPYFQEQWEKKPNWTTEGRLRSARQTLEIMEALND